jgi:hypothetical protein
LPVQSASAKDAQANNGITEEDTEIEDQPEDQRDTRHERAPQDTTLASCILLSESTFT